jgi:hypothetical protein
MNLLTVSSPARSAVRGTLNRYRSEIVLAFALAALTFFVLEPVLDCGFVDYDDDIYVTKNLSVLNGVSLDSIEWAFTETRSNHWHPLTWLSLQRDVELYTTPDGLLPRGFHLTNLLLHIGNVLLLFAVLRQMTRLPWRSAVVAALFAVHPLHVESVAWVTERKDVLSTFFWLLTSVAYVNYAREPGWRRGAIVLLPYVLGLLAKPMLVTLPFTLLLLDYWPLRRSCVSDSSTDRAELSLAPAPLLRLVLEKLPLFLVAALSTAISLTARQLGGGIKSGEYLNLGQRLACAVNAYVMYLFETFWPVNLAPFYPLPTEGLSAGRVAGEMALLVAVTMTVLGARRRCPYLVVGWLWYLGTLLPVSGVVQLGSYAHADRYTYVPSIGLFIGLVWAVADIVPRAYRVRFLMPVAALVVVVASALSWQQVHIWQDSVTLWGHTRAVTPNNFFIRTHLGLAYQNAGRLYEAEGELATAVELRPDAALAHDSLGSVFLRRGRFADAENCFREALQCDPGEALYRNHLEEALRKQGRISATEAESRIPTEQTPRE